ncbi:MAG: hypothetical protein IKZ02_01565 [Alphaproteobacteria bacterium]|nr:hypothetical protein [Alphaproteobacteria bacterium]
MSDISKLLQEAKPLYLKRKKRRNQFKLATGVLGCVLFVNLMIGMPQYNRINEAELDNFYGYLYGSVEEISLIDTSVSEGDSVIPTDEYGFIMVI